MKKMMQTRLNMRRDQRKIRVMQTRIKKNWRKVYFKPWKISPEALEMLDKAMEELHNGYEPQVFDFRNW